MGRKYNMVFKEEAVKLSDEIGLVEAANRLGVPYQTLSEWRKKRTRPGVVDVDGKSARERMLEAENAELKRTVEILRDALVFLPRPQGSNAQGAIRVHREAAGRIRRKANLPGAWVCRERVLPVGAQAGKAGGSLGCSAGGAGPGA